jgi:hypothetical protein
MKDDPIKRWGNIVLVPLVLVNANYFLGFGWFGSYGKIVSLAATFLALLFLTYAIRNWRE